jgi:hypothetical protein
VGRKPDLQLLANGDILVPEKEANGWRMSRLDPDDATYAQWLRAVQDRDREPGPIERGVSFWLAGVLVLLALTMLVMVLSVLTSHII